MVATVSNVMNASRGELLCITYEILLESIEKAIQQFNKPDRKKHIQKAVQVIQTLTEGLNFEIELSKDLFRIYVYVQGLLVTAKEEKQLEEAYHLMHKLYGGFKQVAEKEKTKKPMLKQSESIVAGMTYGKGQLNETVTHQSKGFKA